MIQFDSSVNLGQLITLVVFLAGIVGAAYSLRSQVQALNSRMTSVEVELRKMTEVMVTLGRQDERMTAMDRRIDDLQHGRGFVLELPNSMRAGGGDKNP